MTEGYAVPEPMGTLILDEPPYAGAEIEMRLGISPLAYFGVQHWMEQLPDASVADAMGVLRELGTLFAQHGLDSWNLVLAHGPQKGEPMPATVDAVLSLDARLLWTIVSKWWAYVGTVALPLPEASAAASPSRPKSQRRGSTPGGRLAASSRRR